MNSDLKYQAWVKSRSCMFTVKTMRFADDGVSLLYLLPLDGSGRGLSTDRLDDVALRAYTGIKDRHGKEIYDGDLLHVRFGRHRCEVRWKMLGFGFWNLATEQWQLLYASDLKQIEVIGNIYEGEYAAHPLYGTATAERETVGGEHA